MSPLCVCPVLLLSSVHSKLPCFRLSVSSVCVCYVSRLSVLNVRGAGTGMYDFTSQPLPSRIRLCFQFTITLLPPTPYIYKTDAHRIVNVNIMELLRAPQVRQLELNDPEISQSAQGLWL